MRAIIFNSGLGSRLGDLTADRPKCLVRLASGETILHRQLRMLASCGIRDFVITIGPFAELVEQEARAFEERGCALSFVRNERYLETNYLYSLWCAAPELRGHEVLMLHGDLVFDAAYIRMLLDAPAGSYGSVNAALPQPEKDFKARVRDGEVREVGVGIFDADCIAFQGLYRLLPDALDIWLDEVGRFVERGETGVYAENAANVVFNHMHVRAFSYEGHYVEEVDTPEDLERVSTGIEEADWEAQPAFVADAGGLIEGIVSGGRLHAGSAAGRTQGQAAPRSAGHPDVPAKRRWEECATTAAVGLPDDVSSLVQALGMERPLVVCDPYFADRLDVVLGGALAGMPRFSGYAPNPCYEQVHDGLAVFCEEGCDGLVSLGGGSAIDVAKCIKLWSALPQDAAAEDCVGQDLPFSEVPHLAIPTTAGTGSESTHFAVVYVNGKKHSVAHACAQPDAALLVPDLVCQLPAYQRSSTALDALCQAIESCWSRRSTSVSRAHSARAISAIVGATAYLEGDLDGARALAVAIAANEAGRAINLTTTTAPHAMSYKLTSRFGIAHGHAVALCMGPVWRRLLSTADSKTRERLCEIDRLMCGSADAGYGSGLLVFEQIRALTGLSAPQDFDSETLDELAASVNAQRLSNHPEELSPAVLRSLYAEVLKG